MPHDDVVSYSNLPLFTQDESWSVEGLTVNDSGERLAVLASSNLGTAKIFIFALSMRTQSVIECDTIADLASRPTLIQYQHQEVRNFYIYVYSGQDRKKICKNTTQYFQYQ